MLYLKVIFFLTLIIAVITLYFYFLYKNITNPINDELLKLHIEALTNEKSKLQLDLEKLTTKIVEKVSEQDELQTVILNLTKTANDQKLALIILGLLTVGCIALIAFTYFNSSSGLDAPASSGNIIDAAQAGFTGLLNAHKETTRMITILEIKSEKLNTSIFTLLESVDSLKDEIAVLSVSISASRNELAVLF
jgi:peptidoglycan hydrolase CwlO-like protein